MKRWLIAILCVLLCASLLAACTGGGGNSNNNSNTNTNTTNNNTGGSNNNAGGGGDAATTPAPADDAPAFEWAIDTNLSGEITMWSFLVGNPVFADLVPEFNKVYPNIKVNIVDIEFGEMHDNLQNTLAAGSGAPDIALVEEGQFGRYNYGGMLEDLLQAPYNVSRLKDLIPEYNWTRWQSVDGKHLYGMPWDITPLVTYYRADIIEELGFPSDPAEFGEYIKDAENWITLGEALKASGRYLLEFRDLPVQWAANQYGYFNSNLEWQRNKEDLISLMETSLRTQQLGHSAELSVYGEEGQQYLEQGKLPLIVLGSFAARELATWVPDQAGKWRVTNAPLDVKGGQGGSSFVIPAQSKNKEAAYAFIEWMNLSEEAWKVFSSERYSIQSGYKHIWEKDWYQNSTNSFLGGQRDIELYSSLADTILPKKLTRLDGRAYSEVWLPGILAAFDNYTDPRAALQQIQEDIFTVLGPDIEKFKQELAQ